MEATSPTSNAYPQAVSESVRLRDKCTPKVEEQYKLLETIRHKIATGPPTSDVYPLLEQSESRVSAIVEIRDIKKEMGLEYIKEKLESVLKAFQGIGEKLTPIAVTPVIRNKRMQYTIENGHHRHKISEMCGLNRVPVVYDQEEHDEVVEELERQLSAPPSKQPSEQKYVYPHGR